MKRVLFVSGTDTGVGKTVVTSGLVRALRERGERVVPVKPVETGCADLSRPEDALALQRAAGHVPLETICPVRYRTPAAPWTAGRREGVRHSFEGLRAHIEGIDASWVVVEGAGGMLVPLDATRSFADLAVALNAALVLVVRDALGTLNHTRLSLEAAKTRGIPVAAVIANAVAFPGADDVSHADELRALGLGVPVWGPLPRFDVVDPSIVAGHLASIGLVDALLRG